MIQNFKSNKLKKFYERGEQKHIHANHREKVQDILARLDIAEFPDDMDLPGFGLHPMTANYAGFWSVTVQRNWRVIFQFSEGHAVRVDYLDYHKR